ncbi:MarR family transcriptional regulator [Photobacterium chitinilyticum]|uniref:HTH-type transcriptional regulator MgrA n=2 Tax=Photobacterium chitinilyticum TaxID=2485123 RepID=A0A3S3R3P1_9GAMM|nr:MarR family transcriptional regulator [Photobacterium chitinilyticum]
MFQQASLDINSEQAWILTKAYEKLDEGVHQSDLVTQEQIIGAKSQVSRLIHDLVEKEYLVRRVDPNDRRQTYLTITNSGLERMHQVQDIVQKRKEVYLHTLTIDEYHTLVSLLKKALVGVKED